MSYSDEVQRCFEENPELMRMSPVKMGEWFYIQGILYQSNIVEAVSNKFTHFSKHLSKKEYQRAKESWEAAQSFGKEALKSVEDGCKNEPEKQD